MNERTSLDDFGPRLLPHHATLLADSAITPEVAAARGYRSVTLKAELHRLGFSAAQRCVPALLIPIWGVTGEIVNYQLRPDEPRVGKHGKPLKYETVSGSTMTLDVPPPARAWLDDPATPLWITEGSRKADSAVSCGLCCIALLGVWNWRGTNIHGGKTILPDFEHVALNGRTVYIAFDSDVMIKPAVGQALARLKAALELRNASVEVIYLPPGEGSVKQGLDDYLAAGHGVSDLLALSTNELLVRQEEIDLPASYEATPGGLHWLKPDALPVRLTNFTATIVADVIEDDGVEERRLFEVEATLRSRTTRFTVPAAQFQGLGWVSEHLGAGAIVEPGQGIKERARVAIQVLSDDISERRVYAHTGWREIEGTRAFLHAGGAIGPDGAVPGVEVSLSGSLGRYRLPDPTDRSAEREAVQASLCLFGLLPNRVAVPLLAAVYLAPLREALVEEPPDFVVWLHGSSGTFKTELAALAQAHYGDFGRLSLPVSFAATPNAVERLCSAAKDALLVVDDYHPASDPREAQAMAQVASRLLRGIGNGAGRARMRVDTTLRPELRPRCLVLATGERLPEGHSSAARMFPIAVELNGVDPTRLAIAQEQRAVYPLAMAAYLRHISGELERLPAVLSNRYRELRRRAERAGGHRREPGQIAHLFLALETWTEFATELGVLSSDKRSVLLADAWQVLIAHAVEHGNVLAEETPVKLFLALLADGFASKRTFLESKHGGVPTGNEVWGWERHVRTDRDGEVTEYWRHPVTAVLLGVFDEEWILLYPEATYQFVHSAARAGGRVFPVELRTLLKRLDEAKLIATEAGGRRTVNVWTGQGTRRVIKLRRDALEYAFHVNEGEYREEGKASTSSGPGMPPLTCLTEQYPATVGNGREARLLSNPTKLPGIPDIPRSTGNRNRVASEEVV